MFVPGSCTGPYSSTTLPVPTSSGCQLGIREGFDKRTVEERAAAPDVVPPGAEIVVCDVF